MTGDLLSWLWILIALAAADAQTVRNAVQRSVTKAAGRLPAKIKGPVNRRISCAQTQVTAKKTRRAAQRPNYHGVTGKIARVQRNAND